MAYEELGRSYLASFKLARVYDKEPGDRHGQSQRRYYQERASCSVLPKRDTHDSSSFCSRGRTRSAASRLTCLKPTVQPRNRCLSTFLTPRACCNVPYSGSQAVSGTEGAIF